jgi:hypothetical protein
MAVQPEEEEEEEEDCMRRAERKENKKTFQDNQTCHCSDQSVHGSGTSGRRPLDTLVMILTRAL